MRVVHKIKHFVEMKIKFPKATLHFQICYVILLTIVKFYIFIPIGTEITLVKAGENPPLLNRPTWVIFSPDLFMP